MPLTAAEFAAHLQTCAAAPTLAQRVAADQALTEFMISNLSDAWEYGVTPDELRTGVHGGPGRARWHYFASRVVPPGPQVARWGRYLRAGFDRPRETRIVLPAPTTRLRWLRTASASPAAAFALAAIDERQLASFELAAGSYEVEFSGSVTSRSTAAGESVSITILLDGDEVATHAITRAEPSAESSPSYPIEIRRRGVPVVFSTSNPIELVSPGVLTVVNSGAYEQNANGILKVVPAA